MAMIWVLQKNHTFLVSINIDSLANKYWLILGNQKINSRSFFLHTSLRLVLSKSLFYNFEIIINQDVLNTSHTRITCCA